jgi:hypothetical protein
MFRQPEHTEYEGFTLSVLRDGSGYSVRDQSVEVAILPGFRLPSQVGLPKSFDKYWEGDEEYGGVAAYMPLVVFQNLQYKLQGTQAEED